MVTMACASAGGAVSGGGGIGFICRNFLLNEGVDDVVLQGVHDDGEKHHDEDNLQLFVALGPAERPVAYARQPGEQHKEDEYADFHTHEPAEVDNALLEPPPSVGRRAVVAALDGFRGVA